MEIYEVLDDYPNDSIQLRVYNALAIYEAFQYHRFSVASHYLMETLKIARRLKDRHRMAVTEQNISAISVFIGDSLGINNDEDVYRYAVENNDTVLQHASALYNSFKQIMGMSPTDYRKTAKELDKSGINPPMAVS